MEVTIHVPDTLVQRWAVLWRGPEAAGVADPMSEADN